MRTRRRGGLKKRLARARRQRIQPAEAKDRTVPKGCGRIDGRLLNGALPVMRLRIANIVMAAALCSCNFRIRLERGFSTVLGLTPNSRAINWLALPRAMRVSTSRSRSVVDCV